MRATVLLCAASSGSEGTHQPIDHNVWRAMAIGSEIPQVVDSNIDESFFASSANDAEIEGAFEELGEDRDDIESHLFKSRRSSGKSTSIRR